MKKGSFALFESRKMVVSRTAQNNLVLDVFFKLFFYLFLSDPLKGDIAVKI